MTKMKKIPSRLRVTSTPLRDLRNAPALSSNLTPLMKRPSGLTGKQIESPKSQEQDRLRRQSSLPDKNKSSLASSVHSPSRTKNPQKENVRPRGRPPVAAVVKHTDTKSKTRRKSEVTSAGDKATVDEHSSTTQKKRLHRPGSKALREIRRYQKSTDPMIPRRAFGRVVAEIMQELGVGGLRIQRLALEALREAAEAYLVRLLEHTNLTCIHARRITIFTKDMRLVRRLREDFI